MYGNSQGAGFGSFQETYNQPAAAAPYSQSFPPPAFSGPPGAQPYPAQSFLPGYSPAPGQFNAGSPPGTFNGSYNAPPTYTPPPPPGASK